jgi:hypothetical protein
MNFGPSGVEPSYFYCTEVGLDWDPILELVVKKKLLNICQVVQIYWIRSFFQLYIL